MRRAEERLVELARDLELDSLPRRVLESLTHDRGAEEEERCPVHLRLTPADLQDRIEELVDSTFSDIQSQFLVLPRGDNFVEYPRISDCI